MTMSKLKIVSSSHFRKDLKKAAKRGLDLKELERVVDTLSSCQPLEAKFKDHELSGNYKGCRECHIQPDWLLIYKVVNDRLILLLERTGTHSDLFKK